MSFVIETRKAYVVETGNGGETYYRIIGWQEVPDDEEPNYIEILPVVLWYDGASLYRLGKNARIELHD